MSVHVFPAHINYDAEEWQRKLHRRKSALMAARGCPDGRRRVAYLRALWPRTAGEGPLQNGNEVWTAELACMAVMDRMAGRGS